MKFLIIGGGPVGLFLSIKLLKRFGKNVKIKLFEKRDTYRRNQIVVFQPYLLKKTVPVSLIDAIKKKVCHGVRPAYDNHGLCFANSLADDQNLVSIVINDLEKILKKYLVEIKNYKGSVEWFDEEFNMDKSGKSRKNMNSEKAYQWADIVVGSGGKNSYVRNKVMKAEFVEHDGFKSYGLALTFEDKSNPKYFIKFDNRLKNIVRRVEIKELASAQHRKRFFRSDGKLTYLGLQIDPNEYEGVEDIMDETEKAKLVFKQLPDSLKRVIKGYLKYHNSEPVNLDKVDVYVFRIKLAHSEVYARKKDGKNLFVIGDAAISSHFFTAFGINSGFAEVQNFVDIIENYSGNVDGMDRAIDNYNYVMNQYREENIALGVDATLPFRQIKEICQTLAIDDMIEMAEKEGFGIEKFKELERDEMCALLSRHLLEKFNHVALLPVQ